MTQSAYVPGHSAQPPPPSASHTARNIVIGAVAVLVIVGVILVIVLATNGSGSKPPSAAGSSSVAGSSASAATSASATDAKPSESAARVVVERYFADINAKNEADAQSLICPDQVAGWQQKIHATDGDFTVTISKFTFVSSGAGDAADTLNLKYAITVTGDDTPTTVTFAMKSVSGVKICGEV